MLITDGCFFLDFGKMNNSLKTLQSGKCNLLKNRTQENNLHLKTEGSVKRDKKGYVKESMQAGLQK
jgi:hypothetical protein